MKDPLQLLYLIGFRLNQRRRRQRGRGFDLPVISIGGITAGGSGKTPAVLMIAEFLRSEKFIPVVVTRGYGGSAEGAGKTVVPYPVPASFSHDPVELGDEPAMIATALPEAYIIAGRNRAENLDRALRNHPELQLRGVVLLDDGFQHLQIRRTCDILLLDRPTLEHGTLLPRGRLREPLEAARRADVILFRADPSESAGPVDVLIQQRIPDFHGTIHVVRDVIDRPRHVADGTEPGPDSRPLLVTGVARPDRIEQVLQQKGIGIQGSLHFGDHHPYGPKDVERIRRAMEIHGADIIITTGKDTVKLRSFPELEPVLYTIPHRLLAEDEDRLRRVILDCISTMDRADSR